MGRAQKTIDGYTVNFHRCRFTGSSDVEDIDSDQLVTGDTVVGVFVARTTPPTFREDKHGDITRIDVLKLSDIRVVTGALRKVLVEKLGLYSGDEVSISIGSGSTSDIADQEVSVATEAVKIIPEPPLPEEEEDDEEYVDDQDVFVPPPGTIEQVGSIYDREFKPPKPVEGPSGSIVKSKDPILRGYLQEVPNA